MSGRTREGQRRLLAQEAARVIQSQGGGDYDRARRKAAERLGVGNNRLWPSKAEVQEALREQQRLFQPGQAEALQRLRRQALQAMSAFVRFHPRLVGPVLDGSADRGSRITLQLFAETPDDVVHALLAQGIPWVQRERRVRFGGGERQPRPLLRFEAGEVAVELLVLSPRDRANPPLNQVTERPERGADLRQVEALLAGPHSV
jgi:hypothetical protein